MEFPHLDDTRFPHLDNIDVWQYRNNFDYARWQPDVVLKLCSVKWDADYKHVVNFETNEARDKYFTDLAGHVITLAADSRRVSDTVKVPETYSVCSRYNYLMMQPKYPEIDYSETPRRLYYFIRNVRYLAPNATELELQLDVWTTYINDAQISDVYLERGHAPADAIDADTYLQNPRDNSNGLLTPDVNYNTGDEIVRSAAYKTYAGDKYVCLALPIAYSEFDTRVQPITHTSYSAPTFSNTSARYGYQYQVNGYGWTDTNLDGVNLLTHPSINVGAAFVPATARIYAVRASDLFTNSGWKTLQTNYPYLIDILQGCFIVDGELISLGDVHTKSGISFYEIAFDKVSTALDYKLDKGSFNYESKYADLAKLYTYPYAWLEIGNDAGGATQIRIEDVQGDAVQIKNFFNLTFPFINWTCAPVNVGAGKQTRIEVKNLSGNTSTGFEWDADFTRAMIDMGIPTYSIMLSSEDAFKLRDAGNIEAARNNALVNYRNSARSINTGHANTLDSTATMLTNTANNGNTATRNVALQVSASSANVTRSNYVSTSGTLVSNACNWANRAADQALQYESLEVEGEALAATNTNTMVGGIASNMAGAIGQATTGIALGELGIGAAAAAGGAAVAGAPVVLAGAAIAGTVAAATGAINTVTSNQNSVIAFNAKSDIAAATQKNANQHMSNANSNASTMCELQTEAQTDICNTNNALATNSNANNVNNANTNAGNSAATTNNNSLQARNVSISNAQDNLRATQYAHQQRINQSRVGAPVFNGATTGDATADAYGRRVVAVRVKTQSKNAINRAGDYFIRYGYAYNGLWRVNSWNSSKRFSFWQCSDAICSGEITSGVKQLLLAILNIGVTVWKSPAMEGGYYER